MLTALKQIEQMLDKHPHFLVDEVEAVRTCAQKVKQNAKLKHQMEEERKKKTLQYEKLATMATERHSVLEHITNTLSLYTGTDTPGEIQDMYQYLLRQHLTIIKARDALSEELSIISGDTNNHTTPSSPTGPKNEYRSAEVADRSAEVAEAIGSIGFEENDIHVADLSNIINLGSFVESNLRHRNLHEVNLYDDDGDEGLTNIVERENKKLDTIVEELDDQDNPPSIAVPVQYSDIE